MFDYHAAPVVYSYCLRVAKAMLRSADTVASISIALFVLVRDWRVLTAWQRCKVGLVALRRSPPAPHRGRDEMADSGLSNGRLSSSPARMPEQVETPPVLQNLNSVPLS